MPLTLYLDESGGRPWPKPWGKNPDVHYVLAGLIMDPGQLATAKTEIPKILSHGFPNPPRPKELHYGDLINKNRKNSPYRGMSDASRQTISNEVFDLILRLHPLLMGTVIQKVNHRSGQEARGNVAHVPQAYAVRATLGRFDLHLGAIGSKGTVEMDSAGFQHDAALRTEIASIRLGGTRLSKPKATWANSYLANITSVSFVHSYNCAGVQLADFIAYATWSHYERRKSRRFMQIDSLWRRRPGFREPSVLPAGYR